MRKITRISLALGTSAALLSLSALPASAAPTKNGTEDISTATIEVVGGSLTMSLNAVTGVKVEGNDTDDDLARHAKIEVSEVAVTDLRAVKGGWEVTAMLSNFVAQDKDGQPLDNLAPITSDDAKYATTDPEGLGHRTLSTTTPTSIGPAGAVPVVTATDVVGINTASWNASVDVLVPSTILAANYTATLTHSVS